MKYINLGIFKMSSKSSSSKRYVALKCWEAKQCEQEGKPGKPPHVSHLGVKIM